MPKCAQLRAVVVTAATAATAVDVCVLSSVFSAAWCVTRRVLFSMTMPTASGIGNIGSYCCWRQAVRIFPGEPSYPTGRRYFGTCIIDRTGWARRHHSREVRMPSPGGRAAGRSKTDTGKGSERAEREKVEAEQRLRQPPAARTLGSHVGDNLFAYIRIGKVPKRVRQSARAGGTARFSGAFFRNDFY